MSIQRELNQAHEQGQAACMDGFGIESNPYQAGQLHDAWRRGFASMEVTREQWEDACQAHWDAA